MEILKQVLIEFEKNSGIQRRHLLKCHSDICWGYFVSSMLFVIISASALSFLCFWLPLHILEFRILSKCLTPPSKSFLKLI